MNKVIDDLNKAMHALAEKDALSADDLAFLEQCLSNKWYGVQVVAAKVLAKHHPLEALPLLKDFLLRHMDHFQMRGVAHTAVLWCITEADLSWIFELYLKKRSWHNTFLIGALLQFPEPTIMKRLIQDCCKKDNETSITVLARTLITNRARVLQDLLNDPDVGNKSYLRRAFEWDLPTADLYRQFGGPL
jgi:hypothetical protein